MKHTRQCTKCQSRQLWAIKPLRSVHEYAPGTLPLHLDYEQQIGTNFLNRQKVRVGTLDAWICAKCGYTELWAEGLAELKHAPERGITFIDGDSKP